MVFTREHDNLMSNDIIIEAWNTVLFEKFTRFRHLFVEGYSIHSDKYLEMHPYEQGSTVLDVGCGWGDTTIKIAALVGPGGKAFGVDCAQNYIGICNSDAKDSGVDNAEFFVADVESDDLGGPYDAAFSRCGTMFFTFPGRAMKNVIKSIKPGGKFTQIVWRKREDNAWLHTAELLTKEIVPVISHEETDAVHCGPGPFSMAGPDMVSDMLQLTGYERVSFERFDTEMCIGRDVDEAVEFAINIGPAGEIIRLAEEEGERLTPHVRKSLCDTFGKTAREDGSVWAGSSAWFVTAYKPE
jgi:ubiquinone/menaquinone biosynthesis C-methylase UbiE